jgi:CRP/FNR family cyclic AMP-dependent transcriptional regulator
MEGRAVPVAGSLLAFLDAEQVRALLSCGVERAYGPNEVLVREGDPTDHVQVLRAGWVRVSTTVEDGGEILYALRGPGDVIGEMAALLGWPRTASVRTIEPVRVTQFSGAGFARAVRERPEVSLAVIKALAHRLREAEAARVDIATLEVSDRVVGCLFQLARDHGVSADGKVSVELPLTQQDIADHIGASLRAVARAIAVLRDRGVVHTSRKRITVARPAVLAALARSMPSGTHQP